MKIDIVAIPKSVLLLKLYDNALYQAPKFDLAPAIRQKVAGKSGGMPFQAELLVNEKSTSDKYLFTEVDLGSGIRELHVDLSPFEVDFTKYDDLHGAGTAFRVVKEIRQMIATQAIASEENTSDDFFAKLIGGVNQQMLDEMIDPYTEVELAELIAPALSNDKELLLAQLRESLPLLEKYFADPAINQDKSSQEFFNKLKRAIDTNSLPKEFSDKSSQEFYMAWLGLIDPNLEREQKINAVQCLFQKHSDEYASFAGIVFHLPKIISLEFLRYSSEEVINACQQYREKYGEYSTDCQDYFAELVSMMLHSALYTNEEKNDFLNQLLAVFKHLTEAQSGHWGGSRDLAKEALLCWVYLGCFQSKADDFANLKVFVTQEYMTVIDAFETKFNDIILKLSGSNGWFSMLTGSNQSSLTTLRLDFDSYENQLILKQCFKKIAPNKQDNLFAITRHLYDNGLNKVLTMLTDIGLDPKAILSQHAVLVAQQDYNKDHSSCLFMNHVLKYLKGLLSSSEFKALAIKIAGSLNPELYANSDYAFESIRRELLNYWASHMPQQLVKAIEISVAQKSSTHKTPIEDLVWKIPSECFNDKVIGGLLVALTEEQLITLFSICSDSVQSKIVRTLFEKCSSDIGIKHLKLFNRVYPNSAFPVRFKESFVKHLEKVNEPLFHQAKLEQLFGLTEQVQDKFEQNLENLKQILNNKSLSHDQRRTELHSLSTLQDALRDKEQDTCPLVIKMFDAVSVSQWPYLFTYFDAQIIHWSFPHNTGHLKRLQHIKSELPPERKNTWLNNLDTWQDILLTTLSSIASMGLNGHDDVSDVAAWSLAHVQEALAKTEVHIEGFANTVLKKFFLSDFANSLQIFERITKRSIDKYDFNAKSVIDSALIASWLPEDRQQRLALLSQAFKPAILSQRFRHELSNESFLKAPFVRSTEELDELVLMIINTRTTHLITLLDGCFHCRKTMIESLYRQDPAGTQRLLIRMLNDATSQISHKSEDFYKIVNAILRDISNTKLDTVELISKLDNKWPIIDMLCSLDFLKSLSAWDLKLPLKLSAKLAPESLHSNATQLILHDSQRYFSTYGFRDIYSAVNKAIASPHMPYVDYLASNPEEKSLLVKLILDHTKEFIDNDSSSAKEIKFAGQLVDNFDELLLEQLAAKIKPFEQLGLVDEYEQDKWDSTLAALVQVYGLEVIVGKCRAMGLEKQANDLDAKFKHYPQILNQVAALSKWFKITLNPADRKLDAISPMAWETIHKLNEKTKEVLLEFAAKADISSDFNLTGDLFGFFETSKQDLLGEICKRINISKQALLNALPAALSPLNITVTASGEVMINKIMLRDQNANYLSKAGIKFSTQHLEAELHDSNADDFKDRLDAFNHLDYQNQKLLNNIRPKRTVSFEASRQEHVTQELKEQKVQESQVTVIGAKQQSLQRKYMLGQTNSYGYGHFMPKAQRKAYNKKTTRDERDIKAQQDVSYEANKKQKKEEPASPKSSPAFTRRSIRPDGDCGYTAMGLTRTEASRLLLGNVQRISGLITMPVRQALLTETFYNYLVAKNIITISHSDLVDSLLEQYSMDLAVQVAYINFDVIEKQIDAGYSHPSVLQALALIQNTGLNIWRLGEEQTIVPHETYEGDFSSYTPEHAEGCIDLLFANGNHFDVLETADSLEESQTAMPHSFFFAPKPVAVSQEKESAATLSFTK